MSSETAGYVSVKLLGAACSTMAEVVHNSSTARTIGKITMNSTNQWPKGENSAREISAKQGRIDIIKFSNKGIGSVSLPLWLY